MKPLQLTIVRFNWVFEALLLFHCNQSFFVVNSYSPNSPAVWCRFPPFSSRPKFFAWKHFSCKGRWEATIHPYRSGCSQLSWLLVWFYHCSTYRKKISVEVRWWKKSLMGGVFELSVHTFLVKGFRVLSRMKAWLIYLSNYTTYSVIFYQSQTGTSVPDLRFLPYLLSPLLVTRAFILHFGCCISALFQEIEKSPRTCIKQDCYAPGTLVMPNKGRHKLVASNDSGCRTSLR